MRKLSFIASQTNLTARGRGREREGGRGKEREGEGGGGRRGWRERE